MKIITKYNNTDTFEAQKSVNEVDFRQNKVDFPPN